MAWLTPALATTAVRVMALLVMVSPAPGMAMMAARVTVLLAMLSLAPALALLLLLLPLPALVLAGTRARRLQLKRRHEASGLVRGWRQQLPRLQAAVAAAEA